ncbi:MAG: phosphoribosylaminoimidazolesuccinocarboxamide synthase [Candidatus Moraniibacteriota bacterium]
MAKRRVAVVCGSKSDFFAISQGIAWLRMAEARGLIEVIHIDHGVEACSAHRNPAQLRFLLLQFQDKKVDVVIMCAGKLAALFGDCDAISRNNFQNDHTCFIAVPLKGDTEEASQAAYLSAIQVPNSQFVFKESFFRDPESAFKYAIDGDLPKIKLATQIPPEHFSLAAAYHYGRQHRKGLFPERALYDDVIFAMERGGLIHYATGKTRETFLNPEHPNLLYILATDRISIFDKVLNELIPDKGAVLTAMTIDWLTNRFYDVPNHLVAYGSGVMKYLSSAMRELKNEFMNPTYLMKNMIVVKLATGFPVEAIVRGNLTGSGLKDYKASGKVCGIELPPGLIDGSELPTAIFTPSTKAPYGLHDENIPFDEAVRLVGLEAAEFIRDTSLLLFQRARNLLLPKGIVVADTKFEFGVDSSGQMILIDEALTPDSSRFWPSEGLAAAMAEGKTPPSLDKQPVRNAGEAANVKSNPAWIPPDDLIDQTTGNYRHMLSLATGMSLEAFWAGPMGIAE